MKREIKFRAWNGKYMLNSAYGDWVSFDGVSYTEAEKAKDYILMQFTGLKDKNGKEIYEGDFIQNVTDDGRRLSVFEITWQQSCCGFVKEREDGRTFTLEISKYFEVIGNRFENPELIDFNITE